MIAGVRLSQIAIGEPLIGAAWEYKGLTGKAAAVKRLEDMFYHASYLGFTYVIDTVRPQIDAEGHISAENSGVYGDVWPLSERLQEYQRLSALTGLSVILELQFTVAVTEQNYEEYIRFFLSDLLIQYPFVKGWQIGYLPDVKDTSGAYNCPPKLYARIMKEIYTKAKQINSNVRIGGPGIFSSLAEYVTTREGWFAEAIGDYYEKGDEYQELGYKGFLQYIDFFAFHGRQDTVTLSYNNFQAVVDLIRTTLFNKLGDNAISLFSTYQGWKAEAGNEQELNQQAYYDLREMLKASKCGVVPFKNMLADEYTNASAYNGQFDANRQHCGILYYYLATKPAYSTYQFVLNSISDFADTYKDSEVFEANENIDCITYRRQEEGSVYRVTVLWPKTYNTTNVVLLPANYEREYQIEDGSRRVLSEQVEISLSKTHFVIVYEKIDQLEVDVDYIKKNTTRFLKYHRDTVDSMWNELSSAYNKEVTDTNFYRILRTLAIEMADAKVTLDRIKEDGYIDLAREEAIYQNFGVLVRLQKKSTWTYEKYRRLVKGVMSSLLTGPNYDSIVNALQLFTNFKVSIAELYKEENQRKYNTDAFNIIVPDYAFVVEIEKPLSDREYSQESLNEDAAYVLNIVKPAHTIMMVLIVLGGEENWQKDYKSKYHIEWKDMDTLNNAWRVDAEKFLSEGIYGWKHINYAGVFTNNKSLLNNELLIGPRYVLYDRAEIAADVVNKEKYHKVYDKIINELGISGQEKYEIEDAILREMQVDFVEPRFGYFDNQYIRLSGGMRQFTALNKYKLGINRKLKDEYFNHLETAFSEQYLFNETLNVIRFSNAYGFNAKFIKQNNIITEWAEYISEHSFRYIIKKLDTGEEITVDRLSDSLEEYTNWLFETYDKSSIKELLENGVYHTENVEELYQRFRLNTNKLGEITLGPLQREKLYADVGIADDYELPINDIVNENVVDFNIVYDKPIHDGLDAGPIFDDYTETTWNPEFHSIRLNHVFLNATSKYFLSGLREITGLSSTESDIYDLPIIDAHDISSEYKLNDIFDKPAAKYELGTTIEEHYDIIAKPTRLLRARNNIQREKIDISSTVKDVYQLPVQDVLYAPDYDNSLSEIYERPKDLIISGNFISDDIILNIQDVYNIANVLGDKYTFNIDDTHIISSEVAVDDLYKDVDDFVYNRFNTVYDEKIKLNVKDNVQANTILSDTADLSFIKDTLLRPELEFVFSSSYKPKTDMLAGDLHTDFNDRISIYDFDDTHEMNSEYAEKMQLPDAEMTSYNLVSKYEEKYKAKQDLLTFIPVDAFHDIFRLEQRTVDDAPERFALNLKPLNKARLTVPPAEQSLIDVIQSDKYNLPIVETVDMSHVFTEVYNTYEPVNEAFILDKSKINSAKLIDSINKKIKERIDANIDIFDSHILQPNFDEAFRFTSSKFNTSKFASKRAMDDATEVSVDVKELYSTQNVKQKLAYNVKLNESTYKPKNDESLFTGYNDNHDTYDLPISEYMHRNIQVRNRQREIYKMKSAVAYMQLEQVTPYRTIIIKRGTLVS